MPGSLVFFFEAAALAIASLRSASALAISACDGAVEPRFNLSDGFSCVSTAGFAVGLPATVRASDVTLANLPPIAAWSLTVMASLVMPAKPERAVVNTLLVTPANCDGGADAAFSFAAARAAASFSALVSGRDGAAAAAAGADATAGAAVVSGSEALALAPTLAR